MEIYLFLAEVIASDKHKEYPFGEKHAALLFALALNVEEGEKMALKHFHETHWVNVTIKQKSPIVAESLNNADKNVQEAYEWAMKNGTAGIIFKDALN